MFEFIFTNLHYLIPPIVGFFIGLITNGLAILMLFHPYEEKRLFGIRLPFTPGAIPREHKRLAHKIANTVCEHLLTNEEILEGFENEGVKECVYQSVSHNVDSMLNSEIDSVYSIIPKEWQDDFTEFVDNYIKKISDEINNVLDSDTAAQIVKQLVDQEIDLLLELRLESLFDKEHIRKLEDVIKGVVNKIYHSIGLKDKVYSIINSQLDDFIFSNKKIKEVLSGDMLNVIEKNVIQQTQELTESLFLKLKRENALEAVEDDIKQKAKIHIKNIKFIPRIITEMPITNYKIDSFLDGFMADIRGEDQLNKVDLIVIGKLKVVMKEKLKKLFGRKVKAVITELPSDTISQIKIEIENKLYDMFTDEELEALLIGELDSGIINFEELELQKMIPELTEHEISKIKIFLSETIIHGIRKEEMKKSLHSNILVILEGYLHKKVGNLSHLMSHSLVENIKKCTFDKTFSMIKEQAPELLKQLDIKMLVEKKVEEFPLPDLERIVIQIAGTQLKNITLAGGALGFLIGLLQVLINK
jgi:uncharacterized membrane protein YheB (UPF0754 family)